MSVSPAGNSEKGQMKLIPILDRLIQFLRIGAFQIYIDIKIMEQLTVLIEQPHLDTGKLPG
jgi:hypothetical protein